MFQPAIPYLFCQKLFQTSEVLHHLATFLELAQYKIKKTANK